MRKGRPSDVDELSSSVLLLLEQVHRMVDMCFFAASRTLYIAQQYHLEIPESQEDLNEEEEALRESLDKLSAFLQGIPYVPWPTDPGQISSGQISRK